MTSCSRLVTVSVNWRKNAYTYHVGRGMSTTYPAAGFEHMVDIMRHYMNRPAAAYAGATIVIHPDSDPNYYANDNGNGIGNNYWNSLDYSLRFFKDCVSRP